MLTGKKLFSGMLAAVMTASAAAGAFPVLPVPVYAESIDGLLYSKSWNETSISITGCEAGTTVIDIPAEIDGLPVTEIGYSAFYQNAEITEVSMPDTITKIGERAFRACSALQTVKLSASLTAIPSYCFTSCTALESVEFPEGITRIGEAAFWKCAGLKSVTLPDTVTELELGAFSDCTGMETLTLSAGLTEIGNQVFAECESLTAAVIPPNVTKIDNSAFVDCKQLKSVTLPEGLRIINPYAFENCTALTDITLPDSLEALESNAFLGCTALTAVRIPPLISSVEELVFCNCSSLADVTFAGEIRYICEGAFANTAILNAQSDLKYINGWLINADIDITEAQIAPGTVGIAESACANCKSLESLTLPDSLQYICKSAFGNCSALTAVTLPEGVKEIPDKLFSGCTALQTVNTANEITSIGAYAFSNTALLTSQTEPLRYFGNVLIEADKELTDVTLKAGTVAIADSVFESHTALQSISLPDSLTVIGKSAFRGSGLTDIVIPESVTVIPDQAFLECQSLSSVVLPDTLTEIGYRAFSVCTALTEIEFPASLTAIGIQAFCSCVQFKKIEVPETVTEIGRMALGYQWSDITSGTAKINSDTVIFGYGGSAAEAYAAEYGVTFFDLNTLHGSCGAAVRWSYNHKTGMLSLIGSGDMSSYDTAADVPWDSLRKRILAVTISPDITSLCDHAFSKCSALTEITLPEGLTSIGSCAFSNCIGLTSLTLPDTVQSIGYNLFDGCDALTELTLSASLPVVSSGIFNGCPALRRLSVGAESTTMYSENGALYSADKTVLIAVPPALESKTFAIREGVTEIASFAFHKSALSAVTVPDSVTKIEMRAFYDASSIKTMVLPAGLEYIGMDAFHGCASLTKMLFKGDAPYVIDQIFDGSTYSNMPPLTIYCYFDREGWDDVMDLLELPPDSEWVDLSEVDPDAGLTLSHSSLELEAGKTAVLTASISPLLALDVQFRSDDTHVAFVSADGTVSAVRAGKCTITASSADGKYTAECTVTVTGDVTLAEGVTELPDQLIRYNSVSAECRQIVCAERYGIYLLDTEELRFYSLLTGSVQNLLQFSDLRSSFVQGNLLYLLGRNGKVTVYDLTAQQKAGGFTAAGFTASVIGADAKGRVYLAGKNTASNNEIRLYSANGTLLSSVLVTTNVSAFDGFDATNGNFYYECYYNWRSWGYDHDMTVLRAGRVTDDTLAVSNENIYHNYNSAGDIGEALQQAITGATDIMLYQQYFTQHKNCAEMISDKYLAIFMNCYNLAVVSDSNSFDPENRQFSDAAAFARKASNESNATDWLGTMIVCDEATESVIGYSKDNVIEQRRLGSGELMAEYTAAHPVFSLLKLGSDLLIIEKENDVFYLETVNWETPSSVTISAETDTLAVGTQTQLSASTGTSAKMTFGWSSADPTVASIDHNGTVTAWKAGTVEITVTAVGGLTDTITLTVTPRTLPEGAASAGTVIGTGSVSSNAGKNRYPGNWADTVKSYLHLTDSGELERIEFIGSALTVERFSADGSTLISSRSLKPAQPIFGGVFTGSKYNYVVSGNNNQEESDAATIVTVEKYSKDWTLLDTAEIKGANTYIPFDAGSLRMAESGSTLYIHTCHEMYQTNDGLHHQANMTFVYDQESMTQLESNYEISNNSTGYVSHSFNQFVRVEDGNLYRADHGDASPRGIGVSRASVGGSITDVDFINSYPISGGYGANATGVEVGGFEISDTNCLTAISSVQMCDDYSARGQRNIVLVITDKSMRSASNRSITAYTAEDGITPYTPQLVRFGANAFLLMWEEKDSSGSITVKMMTLDGEGTATSEIISIDARLSDCQPFADENAMVHWYVTEQSAPVFYTVDPYNLKAFSDTQGTLEYTFDEETGTLTISGTGMMKNGKQPWSAYADKAKHLIIKEGVQNIAANAFENFTALEDASLANSIAMLGSSAFSDCTALRQITFPAGITQIPSGLCNGCRRLTKVTLPEGVTAVGSDAFAYCSGMTDLYLPASLQSVDVFAFSGCGKLADVWYSGMRDDWAKVSIGEYGNDELLQAVLHTLNDAETTTVITATTTTETTTTTTTTPETTTTATTESTTAAAPQPLTGDVNGSGTIELADVVALYRLLAEADGEPLTDAMILAADYDGDGILTIRDAALLLAFLHSE